MSYERQGGRGVMGGSFGLLVIKEINMSLLIFPFSYKGKIVQSHTRKSYFFLSTLFWPHSLWKNKAGIIVLENICFSPQTLASIARKPSQRWLGQISDGCSQFPFIERNVNQTVNLIISDSQISPVLESGGRVCHSFIEWKSEWMHTCALIFRPAPYPHTCFLQLGF